MKKVIAILAVALFSIIAFAKDARITGVGFFAPSVSGKSNVYDPEIGALVYDQSDSTFYGFNHSGTWQTLGGSASGVPAGTILPFAGTSAPTGYMLCDGSAVSRATYAVLFGVLSTAYGEGDGSTTFNIPDLRGRFLRGVDGGSGNDPDAASRTAMATGGNTGNNIGSIQVDGLKSHTHYVDNYMGGGSGATGIPLNPGNNIGPVTAGATGGNETRPKNAYVNYIIKI